MKKILITWWSWFIWSHLTKRLLNDWHEVTVIDNLFTWTKKNIYDFINNPKFSFILHDVTLPFWWQFNEIYHLACPASPIYYQKNPIETSKTNFLWTLNMLELAHKTKAKLFQASTSEIYGDPLENPQKETYFWNVNINWYRSCYDEWKRVAETLCTDYNKEYWVDIRIARIFNTYWSNMHHNDWRVVSNFINQILNNQDITIYWDWSQTRSFMYVDDLINWIIKLMNSNYQSPVNLWNPKEISIKDLSEKILELIPKSKNKIIYKQLPSDDPKKRFPDITLAKKLLNWQPKIWLEEWLLKTIEYFKNNNNS